MFIRRLPRFEYHAPASLSEALSLLSSYGDKAKVLAGGTDLLPAMKKRTVAPSHLINLKGIAELKGIATSSDGITIGALTTLSELERSTVIRETCQALFDALMVMASAQVRTLATIGGNICSAVPSADTAPPLVVLGASAMIAGPKGERRLPVEEFFKGPARSDLAPDEILVGLLIPKPPAKSGTAYLKLMRRNAMDLALVGVAARICLDGNRVCKEARIALGAVAPTPIRSQTAEKALLGKTIDEAVLNQAGHIAGTECYPISDLRASLEYRCSMVEVLTRRAVLAAHGRIKE